MHVHRRTPDREDAELVEERITGGKDQFALEMDHMAQCVLTGRQPRTPGEEGVQDHRVMEAIYRSARENQPVRLPEVKGLDVPRSGSGRLTLRWMLYLATVLAGLSNPLQSGSNSALNKTLAAPVLAAFVVYAVGSLCLLACIPFLGLDTRGISAKFAALPWWAWVGGLCNAVFLMSTLLVTKKLGSATITTIVVVAAVIGALLLDNYGLMGFEVRPASLGRIAGGLMAAGGVILIAVF